MWEHEVDAESLPEPYQTIKTLIGNESTIKLLKLQGRAFYLNRRINMGTSPISEIVELIGEDDANILKQHYGCEYLYFKKLDDILRNIRNQKIFNEFDGGNFGNLCEKYGLTEQMIRNIVNDERAKKFGDYEQLKFH